MYQYLLFDLDGTLTNPKEGITRSVQHALRHFGIRVADPDTLTPYIGPPLIPSFMEFHGLTQEQALGALQVYRQRFASVGLFENEVLDGVPEMLRALKQKGRFVAVASSKPEVYVVRILEHFDFLQYFDDPARPQTRLDRDFERGFGISIGRLREDRIFDWRFVCLSHNTVRGAAGGAMLTAELLCAKGYIQPRA